MRADWPIVVAHRGLHGSLPENSVDAMAAAWDRVAWAECDVHESASGHLFVLHDALLEDHTSCAGPIAGRTDAELAGGRLRDGCAGPVTSHRLPQLIDVLRAMPPAGRLLLEIKAARNFAGLVHDLGDHPVRVQSFDPAHLMAVAQHGPELPLAILVETEPQLEAAIKSSVPAVHVSLAMLDGGVGRLRAAGKQIGVWTVNAVADLRQVIARGVDVVVTDKPDLASQIVNEMFGPANAVVLASAAVG